MKRGEYEKAISYYVSKCDKSYLIKGGRANKRHKIQNWAVNIIKILNRLRGVLAPSYYSCYVSSSIIYILCLLGECLFLARDHNFMKLLVSKERIMIL